MKKYFPILIILLAFIQIWKVKPYWVGYFSLSPQHTIDLGNISEGLTSDYIAYFDNQRVDIPRFSGEDNLKNKVLGSTNQYKRIEVDLTNQRIYAYEGDNRVYDFLISSGKWGRTPTGSFKIWIKLRATKMEGGSKALNTYYYLPNVPYVMYFYNDSIPQWRGYGIHGTYWHSNFGHPMSHGCVNMKTEEAQILYYWANPELGSKSSIWASTDNPGTDVIIYGEAPWD